MALDIWFPLAIYYEDLAEAESVKLEFINRIQTLRSLSGPQSTPSDSSWTGDVHNIDQLHHDPAFIWLTEKVGEHAIKYLKLLGHDLDRMDIHVQRAWPIIAAKGQRVSRHAHHTAHLSAVYYVDIPKDHKGGQIRFLNDSGQNELSKGLNANRTGGYAEANPLNFGSSLYEPVEGRIILFPARQPHEVEANGTDHERISISFDLAITSRGLAEDGRHEFLMPSPSTWLRVSQAGALSIDMHDLVLSHNAERQPLAAAATLHAAQDDFVFVEKTRHILWDSVVLNDCSPPAAWKDYQSAISDFSDINRDDDSAIKTRQAPVNWQIHGAAANRLYSYLRARDIPLYEASLSPSFLQQHFNKPSTEYSRGRGHLCIYIRLDYPKKPQTSHCGIEFEDGEFIQLKSGAMAIVSGFRRHRFVGEATIIHYDFNVPAIARIGVLRLSTLQNGSCSDKDVFDLSTARPLTRSMPSYEILTKKRQWLSDKLKRNARHVECPAVQKYLVQCCAVDEASDEDLARIRNYGHNSDTEGNGKNLGQFLNIDSLLTPKACKKLRIYADAHMTANVYDSVDDLPEYQVNLTPAALIGLLGEDKASELFNLPKTTNLKGTGKAAIANIFLRIYTPDTRSHINFHSDDSDCTLNIALNADSDFEGGRLIFLSDDTLNELSRKAGSAFLHAGNVVHGVSKMLSQKRYSLILFYTLNR